MNSDPADLAKEVGGVLLAEWDPIGIRDVPETADEYAGYVPELVTLLNGGVSIESLTSHLLHIERDNIGLSGDAARARRTAEKLTAVVTR